MQQIGSREWQHISMHALFQAKHGEYRILERQPEHLVLHVIQLSYQARGAQSVWVFLSNLVQDLLYIQSGSPPHEKEGPVSGALTITES